MEDYLQADGYFARTNVKYRPAATDPDFVTGDDSNHSDIDVLGLHPGRADPDRVVVVNCKSWVSGFDVNAILDELRHDKIRSGQPVWKKFREVAKPKWARALVSHVHQITGADRFTHLVAVTLLKGSRESWQAFEGFAPDVAHIPKGILTLEEMLNTLWPRIESASETRNLGRTLQLIKHSGWCPPARSRRRPRRPPRADATSA